MQQAFAIAFINGMGLQKSMGSAETALPAVQNIYSMVGRDAEEGAIPYCLGDNSGFVPFPPIASGLLLARMSRGALRLGMMSRQTHIHRK